MEHQTTAYKDFRTFFLHRHAKFAAHYSMIYIFKCLETRRFLDRKGRYSTKGACCTRIRKCQLTFKPLYTVAFALQKVFLRANALSKWCLMSLHIGTFIPLTSSCSLKMCWGRTHILSSKAVELKPLELLGTGKCHHFLKSSALREFCCTVMCMISGVTLCSYMGEIHWGDHVKNTSPFFLFLLLLLLKGITFMFLVLNKTHILTKKEQSMLVKQPRAYITRSSLCFTEQQALKASRETF